ncbi:MAG: type II/IV secretion system protein, partial [Candidatus Omnitrophica bacterium]|nr:type II/IV secretion system protein [Candidatus Omnitrophota bacterium]
CKEAYEPSPEQMKNFNIKIDLLYKPKGCVKCKQLGYRGRTCLAEVMIINEEIRSLISKNASFQEIRDASVKAGMQTLYETGIKKAEEGVTSLEEALSVTMGVQE